MNLIKNKGIQLALMTALFSGLAVFFNKFVVKAVGDPLVFTTLKNLGVGVIMLVLLIFKTSRKEIKWKKIGRGDFTKLGVISVIGGSLPFYLFFKGLLIASSSQAALIHKSLVVWVSILAVRFLKEKISGWQVVAVVGVFLSNFLIGGLPKLVWGSGEVMILMATLLWAIENVIAKKVLERLEVEVVMGARMIVGSLLLLVATIMTGKMGLIFKLTLFQWVMTAVTVGLLSGYVMSWYKAIKQAPITLVATVLSLGSVVTNILSGIFITHSLNIRFIYQSILLMIFSGIFWIESKNVKKMEFALRTNK